MASSTIVFISFLVFSVSMLAVSVAQIDIRIKVATSAIRWQAAKICQDVSFVYPFVFDMDNFGASLIDVDFQRNFDLEAGFADNTGAYVKSVNTTVTGGAEYIALDDDCLLLRNMPANGASPFNVTGYFLLILDSSICASVTQVCATATVRNGSVDSNIASNTFCQSITAVKACSVCPVTNKYDINATKFSPDVTTQQIFAMDRMSYQFTAEATNIGTADLPINYLNNYDLKIGLYDNDLRATAATLLSSLATISGGDILLDDSCPRLAGASRLYYGPAPAPAPIAFSGSVSLSVTQANCPLAFYMCVTISPAGAAFTESDSTTNVICQGIVGNRPCTLCCLPDIYIPVASLTIAGTIFPTDLINYPFQLTLQNQGNSDLADDLNDNYIVKFGFYATSTASTQLGNLVTSGTSVFTINSPCSLKAGLKKSNGNSAIIAGTFKLLLPADVCSAANYICATVKLKNPAITELSATNNYYCFTLSGKKDVTCTSKTPLDLDVSMATIGIIGDTIYSQKDQTYIWKMTVASVISKNSNNSRDSFEYRLQFFNGDVRKDITALERSCYANTRSGLVLDRVVPAEIDLLANRGTLVDVNGTAVLSVYNEYCADPVLFLCISMMPMNATSNGYTVDPDLTNNYQCIDVSAKKKCSKKLSPGQRGCNTASDCVDNSVCNKGTCVCSSNYAPSTDKAVCVKGPGMACSFDYDCVTNAVCSSSVCSCKSGFKKSIDGIRCGKPNRQPCATDADCMGVKAVCTLGVCGCIDGMISSIDWLRCGQGHLFEPCDTDNDCLVPFSVCNTTYGVCFCPEIGYVTGGNTHCFADLNYYCSDDSDCSYTDSYCLGDFINKYATCVCRESLVPSNTTAACVVASGAASLWLNPVSSAILFICVALQQRLLNQCG